MEVHEVLRLPRNLHIEVHKVLRLPRNLHMEVHKVLRLPRTLPMEVHEVLRLPRNLPMEVHKVLCLPRNLHFKKQVTAGASGQGGAPPSPAVLADLTQDGRASAPVYIVPGRLTVSPRCRCS